MDTTALILAPHPDDAELAMGGTIAKLIERGVRVVVADLTDGEPTPHGSPEIRAVETAAASQVLGITERRNLGLKNREIFDTVEARRIVATVIREVRPTLLFVPYWEDAHPDHVQACALCEAARFYAKFVKTDLPGLPWYPRKMLHYFSTHLRVRMSPTFVFDVTGYLDRKIDSITAYASQFVAHSGNQSRIEAIRREAMYWGDQTGVEAAEPFTCRETIRLSDETALFGV